MHLLGKLSPQSKKIYTILALILLVTGLSAYRLSNSLFTSEVTRYNPVDANGAPLLTFSRLLADTDHAAWLMHSREALVKNKWIVRHISWDGHPEGRDMHWSSLLVWLGRLGGEIGASTFKLHPNDALESAQPIVFGLFSLLLLWAGAILSVQAFGLRYGSLLYLALVFSDALLWNQLHPLFFDHHGVIGFFICIYYGSLLKLLLQPSRTAALVGGIAAGLGLWVSALSSAPAIVAPLIGYGGYLAVQRLRHRSQQAPAWPWIWWGSACAATSLLTYLVEYSTAHTLRLEVNSPLYAMAMFGGGILLAGLAKWQNTTWKPTHKQWAIGATALLMVSLPFGTLFLFREEIFTLLLPFWERYPHIVNEGQATPVGTAIFWGIGALTFFLALGGVIFCPSQVLTRIIFPFLFACAIYFGLLLGSRRILFSFLTLATFATFIPIYLPPANQIWVYLRKILVGLMILQITVGVLKAWQSSLIEGRFGLSAVLEESNQLRNVSEDIIRDSRSQRRKVHIIASSPDTGTFLAYYTGGKIKAGIYWESMAQQQELLEAMFTESPKTAEKILRRPEFDYLVLGTNKQLLPWGYVLKGLPGMLSNAQAFESQAREGSVPWLQEIPSSSKVYKIFRILHREVKQEEASEVKQEEASEVKQEEASEVKQEEASEVKQEDETSPE